MYNIFKETNQGTWIYECNFITEYKVVQIWPGLIAACLHTNKSRSYLNHLVIADMFRPLIWPSVGWWEQEFQYNFNVSKSVHT